MTWIYNSLSLKGVQSFSRHLSTRYTAIHITSRLANPTISDLILWIRKDENNNEEEKGQIGTFIIVYE